MFERIDKSYDKDSLRTPKYLFDYLDSIYKFNTDLCASDEYHLKDQYYTKERSHLDLDPILFFNEKDICFCNPPYSNIDPHIEWAIKAADNWARIVFLIPELNGEKRTKLILDNAIRIIHLSPRVGFIHPVTGKECKGNNRGSMVVEFGKRFKHRTCIHGFLDLNRIKGDL